MERYWGFWTKGKLAMLREYLDRFTTTTKEKSTEVLYLDVFGGQPENRERYTNETLDGSSRIALSINDPPFTRLRFFELEPYATRLDNALRSEFMDRDFAIISGDCNETIHGALADLESVNWAPTFAFVDPNGPNMHWTTLEALARFKRSRPYKVEIWLLLAVGMFTRNLPVNGNIRDSDARQLTRMYGTNQWQEIYRARIEGRIEAGSAREEYVNLMRWRLERILGYRKTHALEVFNEQGSSIYHMIFATDHAAGDRIMTSIYRNAVNEFPIMRERARRLRQAKEQEDQGVMQLFDASGLQAPPQPDEVFYEHEPPWMPWFIDDT